MTKLLIWGAIGIALIAVVIYAIVTREPEGDDDYRDDL